MTGGLMQLVAYGAQDIYLTGNPMITYFKVVYRRHTNFAMESIAQTFLGTVGYSNKVSALISRNGDLVNGLTLEVSLPALAAGTRWTDDVGHHLIKQVEVEIGGQLIDRHYSDWLEVWAQLTVPASKMAGYREMIGQSPKDHLGRPNGLQAIGAVAGAKTINVPLQFWFCRNVGLALPLIALQYHEVKVNLTFNSAVNLVMASAGLGVAGAGTAPTTLDATLWVDYIYLDTDERRRFAQVSHEYLIEQLQFTGDSSFTGTSLNVDLNFNHPVKELIWVARYGDVETARQWSNYTDTQARVETNVDTSTTARVISAVDVGLLGTNTANGIGNPAIAGFSYLTGPADGDVLILGVTAGDTILITGGIVQVLATNTIAAGQPIRNVLVAWAGPAVIGAAVAVAIYLPGVFTGLSSLQSHQSTEQNFTRPTLNTALGITEIYANNPVSTAILKLNGHDRFAIRKSDYFNKVQPNNHHTNIPPSPGINVYSFALKPEDHQPSGTCNFSRIDNAKLNITLNNGFFRTGVARTAAQTTGNVKIFATNYNVLRIMSGMGGLAYSN